MKLIQGNKLASYTRREVLAAFTYRLTVENNYPHFNPCGARVPAVTDEQWLKDHAFWVTNDGHLARNREHAEPAYMVDESC